MKGRLVYKSICGICSCLIFLLFNQYSFADLITSDCQEALANMPIDHYVDRAQSKVAIELEKAPHPSFVDLNHDVSIERNGQELPNALQSFVKTQPGLKIQALATPSVNSEHPSVATLFTPNTGMSAHLELQTEDELITTQAYFNMPILTSADQWDDEFLFSKAKGHRVIFYHGHGGGTPFAEAKNTSSIAQYSVERNIPIMAVDQHSHGKNTGNKLLSYDEKIEFNLRILEKVVAPDVKVILSGHSWGGEDLLYFWTQYYPKHKNGRFKQILSQIIGLLPLSPPADVALGTGSPKDRLEIEERLFREMSESEGWEDKIAAKDLEFIKNVLRSGKSSITAMWRTMLTQIYYSLPLPSKDQLSELPNLKIYMGKYDGLVYVGREFAFEPLQELLQENFVLLDTHNTQREANLQQGHQTFDAIDENGHPIVYKGMVDFARDSYRARLEQEKLKQKPWLRESSQKMTRREALRKQNQAQESPKQSKIDRLRSQNTKENLREQKFRKVEDNEWKNKFTEINFEARGNFGLVANLNRLLIYYMSFFPTKEYFDHRKVIVTSDLPHGIELAQEKNLLEGYVKGLVKIREETNKEYSVKMEKIISEISKKYKIKGGVDGAHRELDFEP
ncbi:MAG: hypothetical protein KDD58_05145, partial [Bdellovibrionales bacterium]|nr:hypothetical protein [Bdellovibrionales bacterium]